MENIREPLFDKHKGLPFMMGDYHPDVDITPDTTVKIGMNVHVKYQEEVIVIKVQDRISENEFIGQIASDSDAALSNDDLSRGTIVKFYWQNIVAIEQSP